ncbi:Aste57867_21188 [Aphanomyces stellatus]|uniref:Purple acid phosphatase n=1 Tax=Aphanomyces stellatus TaxID=120398 RepID=A0A485LLJ2_9STRA|nr:hypothetical protein As57867_021120 [Aphanomyces stellatus]VFT97862.1 Aste57867_21188 [Aphanomyces stellatus]
MLLHRLVLLVCVATVATARLVLVDDEYEEVRNAAVRVVHPKPAVAPEQIHLAYAGKDAGTGMTISWATRGVVQQPAVWVGRSDAKLPVDKMRVAAASTKVYYAEGDYVLYNHHAVVLGLAPHTQYDYLVGGHDTFAAVSTRGRFRTARDATNASFSAVVFGDMGVVKSESTVGFLNAPSTTQAFDLIWHIGDVSYADDSHEHPEFDPLEFTYELVFNQYMNLLAPAMTSLPYMVTVGNHEAECNGPACQVSTHKKDHLGNFSAFNTRFRMPAPESDGVFNMWFTWTHGPVTFISINSETDFDGAPNDEGTKTHHNGGFGNQIQWLETALATAHARRAEFPWIIVGTHRPLYSVFMDDTTYGRQPKVRKVTQAIQLAFENLFLQYAVDAVVMGHVHSYERHVPIAHGKPIRDGVNADASIYHNPKAPVYILTGSAGNIEDLTPYLGEDAADLPPWNVFWNSTVYGVSTVQGNRTHLTWQFVDTNTSAVVDEFVMIKDEPTTLG